MTDVMAAPSCSTPPVATGVIQHAVNNYLTPRELPLSSSESNSITLHEFALRSLVLGPETSTDDAIQFSFSTQDPHQIEQQYSKFKIWISESPDSYKPELAQLLYPTFTHLYLELVSCGHKQYAQKFHKRHQSTFLGNAEFANFIKQLAPILTPEEMLADPNVCAFHQSKYSVTLSNRTFHFLMSYLQSCGQPILLHILRGKVDLKLADTLGAFSKAESLKRMEQEAAEDLKLKTEAATDDINDHLALRKQNELSNVLSAVNKDTSPLPTSCLFKLCHPQSNFICASVSHCSNRILAGTEDAGVQVWNFVNDNSVSLDDRKELNDVTRIHLGCDFLYGKQMEYASVTKDIYHRSLASDFKTLRGHRGRVHDVKFVGQNVENYSNFGANQESHYALSVSEDTTMRIWELSSGNCKAIYNGHSYPVWCLDVDVLGSGMVTGSMDKTAALWHLEYTHPIRMYVGHEMDVDCVKFHPNCNYLATGSVDKTVRLWSHADAKMVRVFPGHRGAVTSLAFSPNGKYIASSGEDQRICVWDLAANSLFKELKGSSACVDSLIWSENSEMVISGGQDGVIRIWNIMAESEGEDCNNSKSRRDEVSTASIELRAVWPSACERILDLKFSFHSTLNIVGTAASVWSGLRKQEFP